MFSFQALLIVKTENDCTDQINTEDLRCFVSCSCIVSVYTWPVCLSQGERDRLAQASVLDCFNAGVRLSSYLCFQEAEIFAPVAR